MGWKCDCDIFLCHRRTSASRLTCYVIGGFGIDRKYGVAPGVAAESEWLDAVAAHEVGGQGLHGEGEVTRGGVGGCVEEAEGELGGPPACVAVDDDDGAMVAALRHRRDLQELVDGAVGTVIESVVGEVGQRCAVGIDHEEVAEVCAAPVGDRAERSVVACAGEASKACGGTC